MSEPLLFNAGQIEAELLAQGVPVVKDSVVTYAETWTARYEPIALTEEQEEKVAGIVASLNRKRLRARLATRRWEETQKGCDIVLSDAREFRVQTDDEAQSKLQGAVVGNGIAGLPLVGWKTASGAFEVLTGAQLEEVGSQVYLFVQSCYQREAELLYASGGDLTGYEAAVEQFWPDEEA